MRISGCKGITDGPSSISSDDRSASTSKEAGAGTCAGAGGEEGGTGEGSTVGSGAGEEKRAARRAEDLVALVGVEGLHGRALRAGFGRGEGEVGDALRLRFGGLEGEFCAEEASALRFGGMAMT